jgi:hypothetical protein
MGPVESAIRRSPQVRQPLFTPAQQQRFTVDTIDEEGVTLRIGRLGTRTSFTWETLEGIRRRFMDEEWIVIGGGHNAVGVPGTLDGEVKRVVNRDAAGHLASLLEAAGVVELDRHRPVRMHVIS